jgi:predicted NUDIX family NTP pyrophosphohydrolase
MGAKLLSVAKLSAGLLVYRGTTVHDLEVLLVHPGGPFWQHKDAHAWSIPKGEYGLDDDALAAAEREFHEELGLHPPAGTRTDLGSVRQSGGKQVRAWAVAAGGFAIETLISNEFEMEWPPRSGQVRTYPEVDRAEFTALAMARERVVAAQAQFFDRLLECAADPEP